MNTTPTPTPLPRGRHQLSRDEVETSQRLRLALGTATAMAERGYANTPVADILEHAGVSRPTFYVFYDNKLDCFLDALDLVGEVLLSQLRSALGATLAPDRPTDAAMARAVDAVDVYLDTIIDNLAFARLYIVEVHAAGPRALTQRAALQRRVVDALVDLVGDGSAADRFAGEAFVAAVAALVTLPVTERDVDGLDALREPLRGLLARLFASGVQ